MAKDTKKTEQEAPEAPVLSMEDMQAKFAEMLAEAKAEAKQEAAAIIDDAKAAAAKIVEDAKQSMAPTEGNTEEDARMKEWLNEPVEIKLFKDNGRYKDDVFVGHNGTTYAIKRGERVTVPRKVAMVLDDSELQDYETSVMMESKSAEFANSGL